VAFKYPSSERCYLAGTAPEGGGNGFAFYRLAGEEKTSVVAAWFDPEELPAYLACCRVELP
jgi:hypothetical protein